MRLNAIFLHPVDPCQNYAIIEGEYKRSSEYILQDESPIDDTALASGWYRFDSYVGNDLVNSSQELNRCGTIYPVWMMGEIYKIVVKSYFNLNSSFINLSID